MPIKNTIKRFKFNKWKKLFNLWDKINRYDNYNSAINAINFVLKNKHISKIVIGFENSHQLKSILLNHKKIKTTYTSKLQSNDLNLINPTNWY